MLKEGVFIIAEAGVNHNGSLDAARKMVRAAAEAGADAVKFQTFAAERLVVKNAPKAGYQLQNTPAAESQYEMIKKLELDGAAHRELIECCASCGIEFISSPFDEESAGLLAGLGVKIFKVPSGELVSVPYLRKIASMKRKVILSTGMATLVEIDVALKELTRNGTEKCDITVLHCNTEYPTPYRDVNLNAMLTIKNTFGVNIGYSDHTPGIEIAVAAAALGASVIEKHFTLDRSLPGPDHKASLEPAELKRMVEAVRNVEAAMGDGIKRPSRSEEANIKIARKSIVAKTAIKKGETFGEGNLTIKRPGTGISPLRWDEVIGKPAPRDFAPDEAIEL